jgi:hypothetical protein
MSQQQKDEFLSAYTKVLVAAWTDDEFADRLEADPVAAVGEFGLAVPAEGKLVVTRVIPEDAAPASEDAAFQKWEAGRVTGEYILSVPEAPQVDLSELSESDLVAISAGFSVGCCSCPCSCCA